MYEDILVATDGSDGAAAAVERAIQLCAASGATLHVLSVAVQPDGPGDLPSDESDAALRAVRDAAEATAAEARERAADRGVRAVATVREGTPYRAVLGYAREVGVDLTVVGTAGRAGPPHARPGSTTERVVRTAIDPVLAVPPEDDPDGIETVVVATDGSDAAARAGEHAVALAATHDATVHAVYVLDDAAIDLAVLPRSVVGLLKEGGRHAVAEVAGAARDQDLAARQRVLRGEPAGSLLQYARGVDADLVAMGPRGLTPVDDRVLGSTTGRVLARSPVPVLTVA